jgi:serine/threonine-protein kinase
MRRRIPPMVLAALGAAIVIGASAGAAALVILRAPAEPAPRAAEPAGPEPTAPEPTAPDPAPTSAHSGAPEAEPPEPRALQGEPSAPATAPPERGRQRTAEPPRTGSARKPCDPPYYVDEEGIRRVKRECF